MYCVYKDKKKLYYCYTDFQTRRVWGHGDMRTSPHEVLAATLTLSISTRGGRLCPPYTEYWCPHQVLKAIGAPANYLNFHKNNMYIVLKFFLQARGIRWSMDIIISFQFLLEIFLKLYVKKFKVFWREKQIAVRNWERNYCLEFLRLVMCK